MAHSGHLHTLGACRQNVQTRVLVSALSQLGWLVCFSDHMQKVASMQKKKKWAASGGGCKGHPLSLWEKMEQIKALQERRVVEEMALSQSFRC